jgi:hypothetical protein
MTFLRISGLTAGPGLIDRFMIDLAISISALG